MRHDKKANERCIYCSRTGNAFPREHVISEALGRFTEAHTIFCVCGKCNAYFANYLERDFYRDSNEAILRLLYGIKPPPGALQLGNDRIELRSAAPGDFENCFLHLRPSPNNDEVVAVPMPQAGFRLKGEAKWLWVHEPELKPEIVTKYRVPNAEYKATGPAPDDVARIIAALENMGIRFQNRRELDQPLHQDAQTDILGRFIIDEQIFRCVAKMAFNYVAFNQGANFVLSSDFDPIRSYIRCGKGTRRDFVHASGGRILAGDSHGFPLTYGHVIVCDWDMSGREIFVHLSLFNHMTYTIRVTRHFSGILRPIHVGHHYNVETMRVQEIHAAKIIRPVSLRPRVL